MSTSSPRYGRIVAREDSLFERYIRAKRVGLVQHLGVEIAERDWEALKSDLSSLTERLSEFLYADRRNDVFLVLGRVQSGKTAHLIGVSAWCASTPVSAVFILSGSTLALGRQTQNRLETDLSSLGGSACQLMEPLPTAGDGKALQNFKSKFLPLVAQRRNASDTGTKNPLPIVTVLKTAKRLSALRSVVEEIGREVGQDSIIVVIDDEADQISQNGKLSKSQRTEVNNHLVSLQDSGVRVATIAYTATPQAILLSERLGRLQPREVAIVSPGSLYFGLNDVLSTRFYSNRRIASQISSSNEAPRELYEAVAQFSLSSMICHKFPEVFYTCGPISTGIHRISPDSCQMLVHPSGSTADHRKYFQIVENCRKRLVGRIDDIKRLDKTDANYRFFLDQYSSLIEQVHDEGLRESLPSELTEEILSFLRFSLDSQTKVKVVNSDPQRADAQSALPISQKDWNKFQNWILIGGDILGRGLTIPQLLVTYFLRNPKKPKFDTSMQQMRFCGYRRNYQDLTSVWAPTDVFSEYEVIGEVEEALIRQAKYWSVRRTDFHRERPSILYLSRTESRLEPTRKNVIDPGLKDHRIRGNIAYQSKSIFQALDVRQNASNIVNFLDGMVVSSTTDGWHVVSEPDLEKVRVLVSRWKAGRHNSDQKRVSALFDETLGDFGFVSTPVVCFVRNPRAIGDVADGKLFRPEDLQQSRSTDYRGPLSADEMFEVWRRDFENNDLTRNSVEWYHKSAIAAYVGDTQRALQHRLEYDATCVIVEPISITKERRNRAIVAQGIALAVLAPQGFRVRMMGFD